MCTKCLQQIQDIHDPLSSDSPVPRPCPQRRAPAPVPARVLRPLRRPALPPAARDPGHPPHGLARRPGRHLGADETVLRVVDEGAAARESRAQRRDPREEGHDEEGDEQHVAGEARLSVAIKYDDVSEAGLKDV